jgi:hypothetical protein
MQRIHIINYNEYMLILPSQLQAWRSRSPLRFLHSQSIANRVKHGSIITMPRLRQNSQKRSTRCIYRSTCIHAAARTIFHTILPYSIHFPSIGIPSIFPTRSVEYIFEQYLAQFVRCLGSRVIRSTTRIVYKMPEFGISHAIPFRFWFFKVIR